MNALLAPTRSRFRPMLPQDLGTIARIEKRAYPYPWTKGIFKECLNAGYCCQLLMQHEQTVGYGILSVAVDEAHLLNLCIDPAWQGRGLARRLLQHMTGLARAYGASSVFLEVRPSNTAALSLYSGAGFCEVGIRRGYYPATRGREDALIMALSLHSDSEDMDDV